MTELATYFKIGNPIDDKSIFWDARDFSTIEAARVAFKRMKESWEEKYGAGCFQTMKIYKCTPVDD